MPRFCLTTTAVFTSLFLLFGSQAFGESAFLPADVPDWVMTQFDRSPKVFSSIPQAEKSLNSLDPLMRRSGVQWLSNATGVFSGSTFSQEDQKANAAQIRQHKELVPLLARFVVETPAGSTHDYSSQAARLMALIEPSGRMGLPAVCTALVEQGSNDSFKRYEVMNALIYLCGGPDRVALELATLMHNQEPAVRRAAAGAAGLCGDLGFNHIGPPPDGAVVLSSAQDAAETKAFRGAVIPALAHRVNDPVTAVRLAALTSLSSMTYDTADAPWQAALPAVSQALNFPGADQRLVAAQILAYVPRDVSPAVTSLRTALHKNDEAARPYLITAVSHAAWSNPAVTLNAFLPDLASANVEQRRSASADIRCAGGGFWTNGMQPTHTEILNKQRYLDMVYEGRMISWSLEVDKGVLSSKSVLLYAQRHKASDAAKARMLAALVKATADPDHIVRTNAAFSLEKIGQWTDGGLSRGYFPNPAVEYRPQVEQALTQAAETLKTTEPDLAKQIWNLIAKIQTPHATG